ncbi:MAG: glucosaminidase domain-containing protein [Chitinophagaceae bacterium]
MKKLLYLSILICSKTFAQDSLSVQRYIDQYKDMAMAEMQRTGVPAAITLAQGIHESSFGTSELVLRSNNHFGIKCKSDWTGRSVRHDDDASQECFRAYDSACQSYKDHSDFLRGNQRYAFLFQYDPTNYQAWAKGLKQAGYATNPRYAPILVGTIERFHLNDYTLLAINRQPVKDTGQNIYAQAAYNTENPPIVNVVAANRYAELVRQTPNANFNLASTYPTGVFDINNCKVVFAEKGMSLLALAIAHKVSMPNLITWNDMDETDIVPESQLIFLEKKQKKGKTEIHEVKPGETLWQISQVEGVRLTNLLQYNKLSDNNIPAVGEKIYLQGYTVQQPKLIGK